MPIEQTKRTKDELERRGYVVTNCSYYNTYTKRRHDLFGLFDQVAIDTREIGVTGVQVTSRSNMAARVRKIKESDYSKPWLHALNSILVIGWDKYKNRWRFKERWVTLEDLV